MGRLLLIFATWLTLSAMPGMAGEPAAAVRNTYKVEVIIFRYTSPPVSGEDLTAAAEGRGFGGERRSTGAAPSLVRQLDSSELEMTATVGQLRASGTVAVLAHGGWIQTASNWGRHVGLSLQQFGIDAAGLTGELFLERGELLHFGAQLKLNNGYALSELRKVRYNERHFLDHPAFGIIVEVSPVR